MRITNAMMTNTTLMHINRNMRQLDEIIRQIETTKRIQRPSDNPIIASRALKFRTSVHENEQFQLNVDHATAWMNVTEATFNNVNRELIYEINRLLVQGINQTNNLAGQRAVVEQIRSLFDELGNTINHTFAGQYLFSGLRTNEPPMFTENNNRSFVITQHFNLSDIAREQSFQRLPSDDNPNLIVPRVIDISVLKLAYTGLDGPPHIPGFEVREFSINDENAYLPPAGNGAGLPVIHFIPETGELVMHSTTANSFPQEGVSVTFQKTGFRKGDLNPAVYFTAREIIDTTLPADGIERVFQLTQYFSRASGERAGDFYEFTLAHPPSFGPGAPETALRPILPPGAEIDGGVVRIPARLFETTRNVSVSYSVTNPVSADGTHIILDPRVQGVRLVRAMDADGLPVPLDLADPNFSFDMHNQEIRMEFSTNTHMAINSLAKNLLTDKMFADFRRFFEFSDSLRVSERATLEHFYSTYHDPPLTGEELRRAVDDRLNIIEYSEIRAALYHQFNNMLFLLTRHADNSTREQTLLGSRMVRMELVQNRLEHDYVVYNDLVSDNEDTDMIRAMVLRESAQAAFLASLRANSGIVQMSLANFIR